jgi:radical SAM-linked protein
MSLAAPLPTGYLAKEEILEFELQEPVPAEEILRRLRLTLPAGISVQEVQAIGDEVKSAASRVDAARYLVELPTPMADLEQKVRALRDRTTLEVEEVHHGVVRVRDLHPLLLWISATSPSSIEMLVKLSERGTIRPEQILQLMGISSDGSVIVRVEIELG